MTGTVFHGGYFGNVRSNDGEPPRPERRPLTAETHAHGGGIGVEGVMCTAWSLLNTVTGYADDHRTDALVYPRGMDENSIALRDLLRATASTPGASATGLLETAIARDLEFGRRLMISAVSQIVGIGYRAPLPEWLAGMLVCSELFALFPDSYPAHVQHRDDHAAAGLRLAGHERIAFDHHLAAFRELARNAVATELNYVR